MVESFNPDGRPTKYKPEYDDMAHNLMLLGLTMEEIAKSLGVHKDTIYEWMSKHETFSDAIRSGGEPADGIVARRLWEQTKTDTRACQIWLTNRRRKSWQNNTSAEVTIKTDLGKQLDHALRAKTKHDDEAGEDE